MDSVAIFCAYDEMVLGIQNYYKIATCISLDCKDIHRAVMTVLTNRLNTETGSRLMRTGGTMTKSEKELYGSSKMIRYVSGIERPIYPIAYIKYKVAIGISSSVCCYTEEGRAKIHENLKINHRIMSEMISQKMTNHSLEYMDCRQSLFSVQKGKCSVSGEEFISVDEVGCCLKKPKELDGREQYHNMVLVKKKYLPLILEEDEQKLQEYINAIKPEKKHLKKINKLRKLRKL